MVLRVILVECPFEQCFENAKLVFARVEITADIALKY